MSGWFGLELGLGLGLGLGSGLGLGLGSGLGFGLGIGIRIKVRIGIGIGTVIGCFFLKNMSSGIIFSDIFGFVGHFFVSFCVSGRSFDVFGALGGPGGRHTRNDPLAWGPFGSISAPFFEQNRIIFMLFFDCFSGCLVY